MTCISQKSKISPRRSFLHGLSLFALACALPCYFSFAARRGCRRVPLNRSTPRRPCRRAAKTPQQRQMRTQARLQRPLCALSPSARSSLVHSRQARALPSFIRAKRSLFPTVRRSRSARPPSVKRLRSAPRQSLSRRFSFPREGLLFALVGLSVPSRLFVPSRRSCTSVRLLEGE